jgi:NADPH:quinone reductase-like Zn-dependent oxidoreductase
MTSIRTLLAMALVAASPWATAAPAKMQAIVAGTGEPKALELRSIDTPTPAANQVLIQVFASGVNPVDWKNATTGAVPGYDVAGVIDSVGSGVTTFKPGDPVMARAANGAYAQYAVADLDNVARKPAAFSFEQAAGVPVAGVAGHRLATWAKVRPGQRVVVIGAAGGSGSAAVETANSLGGHVIGVGHSSQESYLRKLGIAEFVAYDKENVGAKVQGVDVVLNTVDSQVEPGFGYVRRGGVFSSITGVPTEEKCAAAGVTCVQIGRGKPVPPAGESLRPLAAMADAGKYTVTVSKRFPLAQAAAAQESLRTSEGIGKTILIVDPSKATQH